MGRTRQSKKAARQKRRALPPESERLRLERKALRQRRRRDEIVAAAEEVASARGLDGFTAEDVARALSISTPSVFYYFAGGLSELRAAVALRRVHARYDAVAPEMASASSGAEALIAFARGLVRSYQEDVDGFGKDIEVMLRGSWDPALVAMHVEKLNALFTLVEERLLADRQRGRLHEDVEDLRRLAMLMNQLVLGLVVGDQLRRKVGGSSKHALTALTDDLCALVERGLARAPARRPR